MIQRVLKTNQIFGVNLIKKGEEALGPLPEPYEVGCTARVVKVDALEDGHINLTVVGDERFRVLRMGVPQDYLMAYCESTPLAVQHTLEVVRGAHGLRHKLISYLDLLSRHNGFDHDEDGGALDLDFDLTALQLPEDPMMLIYLASALLQVPAGEKQPLLEADTAALLLVKLQRLYRRELAVLPPLLEVSEEEARLAAWVN